MKKLILSVLLTICCQQLCAADRINLLVAGNDSDKDAIRSTSRMFRAVIGNLNTQMHDSGFDVYTETELLDSGYFSDVHLRNDRDLIKLVRSINRPPIDVIVLFELFTRIESSKHADRVAATIQGRMLHVETGRFLGSFATDSSRNWLIPANCIDTCRLSQEEKYAKILANDLGAVLAEKLACLVNQSCDALDDHKQLITAYEVQFIGFNQQTVSAASAKLSSIDGYISLRPTEKTKVKSVIWYESQLGSADFYHQLTNIIHSFDTQVQIRNLNNIFQIRKPTKKITPTFNKKGNDDDW